jgi:hypothetical protein
MGPGIAPRRPSPSCADEAIPAPGFGAGKLVVVGNSSPGGAGRAFGKSRVCAVCAGIVFPKSGGVMLLKQKGPAVLIQARNESCESRPSGSTRFKGLLST